MVKISASKTHSIGFQVQLEFQLTQHVRDEQLMRSLIKYLDCGNIYQKEQVFDFRVRKFQDIVNKIIPFFKNYPIVGVKALDFAYFCRVAEMMKNKAPPSFNSPPGFNLGRSKGNKKHQSRDEQRK